MTDPPVRLLSTEDLPNPGPIKAYGTYAASSLEKCKR
jgi:hypothetical protein